MTRASPRQLARSRVALPIALLVALTAAVRPGTALAQLPGATSAVGPPTLEMRADLVAGRATTAHAGGGIVWPVGRYARLGVLAGAGATRVAETAGPDARSTREWRPSARGELVARFVVERADRADARLYAGAGMSVLGVDGARPLTRLLLTLGAEGRARGGLRPALEVGLGGGARVGVVLRRADRAPR